MYFSYWKGKRNHKKNINFNKAAMFFVSSLILPFGPEAAKRICIQKLQTLFIAIFPFTYNVSANHFLWLAYIRIFLLCQLHVNQ